MYKDKFKGYALKIDLPIVPAHIIVDNNEPEVVRDIKSIVPFKDIFPKFLDEVFSKKIIVANKHFGNGTAKELPAVAIKNLGVQAIIAKDFCPIFYKNAFNIGLLCIVANTDYIDDEDELKIDIKRSIAHNLNKQIGIKFLPLKKYFYKLYQNGGLLQSINELGGLYG